MKTIHKYKLEMKPEQFVKMPKMAEIIKCEYQRCNEDWTKINLCMWAIIDTNDRVNDRYFRIVMTGEEVEDFYVLSHVDTVISENGQFVAHIFQKAVR